MLCTSAGHHVESGGLGKTTVWIYSMCPQSKDITLFDYILLTLRIMKYILSLHWSTCGEVIQLYTLSWSYNLNFRHTHLDKADGCVALRSGSNCTLSIKSINCGHMWDVAQRRIFTYSSPQANQVVSPLSSFINTPFDCGSKPYEMLSVSAPLFGSLHHPCALPHVTVKTKVWLLYKGETWDALLHCHGDPLSNSFCCKVLGSVLSSLIDSDNTCLFSVLSDITSCDDFGFSPSSSCDNHTLSLWVSRRANQSDSVLERSLGQQAQLPITLFLPLAVPSSSRIRPPKSRGRQ